MLFLPYFPQQPAQSALPDKSTPLSPRQLVHGTRATRHTLHREDNATQQALEKQWQISAYLKVPICFSALKYAYWESKKDRINQKFLDVFLRRCQQAPPCQSQIRQEDSEYKHHAESDRMPSVETTNKSLPLVSCRPPQVPPQTLPRVPPQCPHQKSGQDTYSGNASILFHPALPL